MFKIDIQLTTWKSEFNFAGDVMPVETDDIVSICEYIEFLKTECKTLGMFSRLLALQTQIEEGCIVEGFFII